MRKTLVLILLLAILVTNIFIAFGEEIGNTEIDDNRVVNQEKAIKIYDKLMRKIVSEESKYLDSYAGSYLDEGGNLVILVKAEGKNSGLLKKLLKQESVTSFEVEYSHNELLNQKSTIQEIMEVNEFPSVVHGIGINYMTNKVGIYVTNLNEYLSDYSHLLGDMNIEVHEEPGVVDTTSIINGGSVTALSPGSAGFGAYRNYKKGIIISGHLIGNSIGTEISYQGNPIGKITAMNYYDGMYSDAAFVELYSGHTPTNDIIGGYDFTGYSTSVIQNATVLCAGSATGYTYSGRIDLVSYSDSSSGKRFNDFFKMTNVPVGGDSGGPIWYPGSGYRYGTLIGTIKGRATNNTYGIGGKIEHIIWDLQLDSIITN